MFKLFNLITEKFKLPDTDAGIPESGIANLGSTTHPPLDIELQSILSTISINNLISLARVSPEASYFFFIYKTLS